MSRTSRLRQVLGLSQTAMGERMLVSQSTVDRLEKGQPESALQAHVLDQIEAELGAAGGSVPAGAALEPATETVEQSL